MLETQSYVVTVVRWSAERVGSRAEGDEIAVYRVADGLVAEAWFFPEISDAVEHATVFTLSAYE